jgi:glutathione gamma-glutamylcysteinyltransferase
METLYRRPLPADAVEFSSPPGRQLFTEAFAAGGLEGYFPLAEQFHTQAEPTFCGLGSLVVALNALAIDPGRLWKGPWRWFSEELLDCCVPLEEIRRRGLDLDQLTFVARCNGAEVELHRADLADLAAWRASLGAAARGDGVVIASYDRSALDQTGAGHFSPIGGYHAARDLALVLDVARFKYPPHWIGAERLWRAMQPVDPATGRARGWMLLRRRARGVALGFTLTCVGTDLHGFAEQLAGVARELGPAADIGALSRALAPLTSYLAVRSPGSEAHRAALARTRAAVRNLAVFPQVREAIGGEGGEGAAVAAVAARDERTEAITILLLAIASRLPPAWSEQIGALIAEAEHDEALASELASLRAQLAALWTISGDRGNSGDSCDNCGSPAGSNEPARGTGSVT